MEKNPEQSNRPENKEYGRPHIEMQDLATFSGVDLEELGRRSVEEILDRVGKDDKFEGLIRRKFGLSEETPFDEALRGLAERSISEYQKNLAEKMQSFRQQGDDCITLVQEQGYLSEVDGFRIILTDDFIHYGLEPENRPNINSFSEDHKAVYVRHTEPNRLVAHEVGHALSTRYDEGRTGFTTSDNKRKQTGERGNKWFNEGVTIMWEDLSVNDGSSIPSREDPHDMYNWYREATRLIIEELKLDDDTVFKAYFGDRQSLDLVEEKVNERFGYSLDDLQCLALKLDIDFTKSIIAGENVELTIKKTDRDSKIETIEKLVGIFPNVSVIDKRKD